ncbi:MAG: MBL fold metallo-hydrolase [Phycisphaeraceae bacterium]
MDFRIISIGTLSHHELWGEKAPVRTAHATTTLVRSGGRNILVDPGLPGQAVVAHLMERSGLAPAAITDVFLTNFRPAHRWGLPAFEHATWHISEAEREAVGSALIEQYKAAQDAEVRAMIEQEIAILKRCQPAPDQLARQVDLFPLPGFTPGTCGLLLLDATSTTLIAGDAVPTSEHLASGQILASSYDLAQARESFAEAIEIADAIIPGHDNIVLNPARGKM